MNLMLNSFETLEYLRASFKLSTTQVLLYHKNDWDITTTKWWDCWLFLAIWFICWNHFIYLLPVLHWKEIENQSRYQKVIAICWNSRLSRLWNSFQLNDVDYPQNKEQNHLLYVHFIFWSDNDGETIGPHNDFYHKVFIAFIPFYITFMQ